FSETFETLIRHAENHTNTLFRTTYRNMAADAAGSVKELFTDVGLFVLGSEVSVEDFVNRFFDSLFPLVYNHLINPGLTDITINYAECIRMTRRDLNPFGNFPKLAVGQIGRSMLPGRVFLQALNLGIEVINTTDHLQYTKECKRALLKMQYCPHCQGLTQSKPCMGYCLNVIRGCLANMAEIDSHWREYVRSLEEVSNSMHGSYDVEQVLLNLHSLVNDAIMHAQINGPKLSAMYTPEEVFKNKVERCRSHKNVRLNAKDLVSLKVPPRNTEESLASRRKEFINSLRLYQTFYAGLADHLCVSELASSDGLSCWNGADVVKRFYVLIV
uniref:Glypican 5a n=1 Tax=Lepisosteus oculatus TaxID=7918 RepID=W5MBM2_LEPOC